MINNFIQKEVKNLLSSTDLNAKEFAQFVNNQYCLNDDIDFEKAKLLLNTFCQTIWQIDKEEDQRNCFDLLSNIMEILPSTIKREIIPLLIEQSLVYSKLVFLAKLLFISFSIGDRRTMKLPLVRTSQSDDFTIITEAEFLWRQKHNLSCWRTPDSFRRPMVKEDLDCFYQSLSLIYYSDNTSRETIIVSW